MSKWFLNQSKDLGNAITSWALFSAQEIFINVDIKYIENPTISAH